MNTPHHHDDPPVRPLGFVPAVRARGVPVGSAGVRVLLGLLRVWARGEALSVRAVAVEAGRCQSATYRQLVVLRELGLVAWEPGRRGTMRPTVGVVAW